MFASKVEEDIGLLNRAAPHSGAFYWWFQWLYEQTVQIGRVLTRIGVNRYTFLPHSELPDWMIDGVFSYLMILFIYIDYVALNSRCMWVVNFKMIWKNVVMVYPEVLSLCFPVRTDEIFTQDNCYLEQWWYYINSEQKYVAIWIEQWCCLVERSVVLHSS